MRPRCRMAAACVAPRVVFAVTLAVTLVAAPAGVGSACAASPWPNRPVTIIVPFGAGSGTDIATRVVAEALGSALGQNVVVDDRPGANGGIAAGYVAKAGADGYTLLMGTNSSHSFNPVLLRNLAYDPVKDFAPITRIGSFTLMFAVNPAVPASSLTEVIAYARANPGRLAYASGNTSGILAGETLKRWAGIDVLHVPYKSVPQALNDVIAGRVAMGFSDLTPVLPHVAAGTLRPIAVTRLRRSALLPDLPTFDEAGLKDFEVESWAGLFAPAGTPAAVIARLNGEMRAILDDPRIRAQLGNVGFEAVASTPEALDAFVREEIVRTARMAKDAGLEPQ